jgi:hypothetical protein
MKTLARILLLLSFIIWLTARMIAPVWSAPNLTVGKPLLPQAMRLFPLDGSFQKGGVEQPWLSSHELLHFKKGQLYRYDMTAKTDTPLPALTQQIVNSPASLDFVESSPDGKWVLWGESANGPIFAASVDGAQRFSWPGNGGLSEPYWCADCHHWLQILSSGDGYSMPDPKTEFNEARLQDVDAPQHTGAITDLPPGLHNLDVLAVVSETEVIARTPDPVKFGPSKEVPTPGGAKPGETSFIIQEKDTYRATQQISVWDLRQRVPLHRWTVRLPGLVQEVVVSPQGDRVAWLIQQTEPKARGRVRLMCTSLWVSGLDGSGLREVGYVAAKIDAASLKHMSLAQMEQYAAPLPMQPHWSPDGEQMSFQCAGALWAVHAP